MIRLLAYCISVVLLWTSCGFYSNNIDDNSSIDDISEMKGKTVAVVSGTTHDTYLIKKYPDVKLVYASGGSELIPLLYSGHIDGALLSSVTLKLMSKQYPDLKSVGEPLLYCNSAFGFKDDSIRDKFNIFLFEKRKSGELDSIINKWETDYNNAPMPQFENSGKDGKLVVGMAMSNPFSYIRNDEMCGIDVELISEFASLHNLELEFKIVNQTAAALVGLKTGKFDVICSGITVNEERAKSVKFSDSYYKSYAILVVRDKEASSNSKVLTRIKDSINRNLIQNKHYMLIVDGLKTTINISFFAFILSTILASLICWSRMVKNKILNTFAKVYVAFLRGVPVLVLLLLLYYVVFASSQIDGIAVSIIALGIYSSAPISELFRSSIQNVDPGQKEAGMSLGFSKIQTFFYIVMPQALRTILPVYKNELVSLVKMSSIVGFIAVQDLTRAGDIIRSRTFDAFFSILFTAALYLIITFLLTSLLSLIGKKNGRNY